MFVSLRHGQRGARNCEPQHTLAFSYSASIVSTSVDTCLVLRLGLLNELANKHPREEVHSLGKVIQLVILTAVALVSVR